LVVKKNAEFMGGRPQHHFNIVHITHMQMSKRKPNPETPGDVGNEIASMKRKVAMAALLAMDPPQITMGWWSLKIEKTGKRQDIGKGAVGQSTHNLGRRRRL
jgi:hypothetical protein